MIWYQDRYECLAHAAAECPLEGLVLEFGVATGATINYLACSHPLRERRIHGFDSFGGLPEPWGNYPVGHFACDPPLCAANVELHVGLFAETLPQFLEAHSGDCALIHLDADLYSSTTLVLEHLHERIVPGTIIVMDEFYIVTQHEQRAWNEYLSAHTRNCRHLCRCPEGAVVMME